MGRRDARTTAMQCFYQMNINESYNDTAFEKCVKNAMLNKSDADFAISLGKNFLQNVDAVDEIIKNHLKDDWKMDRISMIELAILRVSISEMLYLDDVPNSVSINEAVELAKKFADETSSSFVNGLLGSWLRSRES